jgi:protease IV
LGELYKSEVPETNSGMYVIHNLSDAKFDRKPWIDGSDVILQLNIVGEIGGNSISQDFINDQLLSSHEGRLKNSKIKGLFLLINTPGGTVIDSEGIYNLIMAYKKKYKVPVYAHIEGLCTSGGYMIACAADKVVATTSSVIGSVGVKIQFLNFYGLMEKIGVKQKTLYRGIDKDEMSPFTDWDENEGVEYQALVDFSYENFLRIVQEQRPQIDIEKMRTHYGAKLFTPEVAFNYHYIDGYGLTRMEALKDFVSILGLNDEYRVIQLKKRGSFNDLILASHGLKLMQVDWMSWMKVPFRSEIML